MVFIALDKLFTKKQQQVMKSYLEDEWRILILAGSVRSGKTYINNYLFLMELRRVRQLAQEMGEPHPLYILAGYSSSTIKTNVITSLESQFGISLNADRHGHYHLFGVEIVPAYTNNDRGVGSIRGLTAFGAYVNETSLATQDVFQEITNRCSVEGSRVICDTNPDVPTHWLKTEYIDNTDPKARIKSFSFTIDDNTFLAQEYVDSLKAATPSGMFYDRAIRGLWVTADGLVYRDFDKDKHIVDKIPDGLELEYYVGVDWGFEHYTSFVLLGDAPDGTTYVVKEFTDRRKTIDYWVGLALELCDQLGRGLPFYCDSARPDNINELIRHGVNAQNANKTVLAGVECVSSKLKQGKLKIYKHGINRMLEEFYKYVWDDKTGEPNKRAYDPDVLDALRYGIYTRNYKGGYTPWT